MKILRKSRIILFCSLVAALFLVLVYLGPSVPSEKTLIILKPDAVSKNVKTEIYAILHEKAGVSLVEEVVFDYAPEVKLSLHYEEHREQGFYLDLLNFMKSGPVIVSVWEGPVGSIEAVRRIVGVTNPAKAGIDTIRGKYGTTIQRNAIHASDSSESAFREIQIWFG